MRCARQDARTPTGRKRYVRERPYLPKRRRYACRQGDAVKIVVYDFETYEAITFISVPNWRDMGMQPGEPINVPITPPPEPVAVGRYRREAPPDFSISYVTLRFEWFRLRNSPEKLWLAFVNDAESALLLRSIFMPGQHREVRARVDMGYAKGYMQAISDDWR
jgi:hypothetical protein